MEEEEEGRMPAKLHKQMRMIKNLMLNCGLYVGIVEYYAIRINNILIFMLLPWGGNREELEVFDWIKPN